MTYVKLQLRRESNTTWLSRPGHDHLMQFYDHEQALVSCLLEYVTTGLRLQEACVIIATPHVLISLQKGLRSTGVDVARALADETYITYDAEELVMSFMDGRVLNIAKFRECIDRILTTHQQQARPLRVYGETAAVLLAQRNLQAALLLEREWSQIVAGHQCSLYCACSESSLREVAEGPEMEDVIAAKHTLLLHGAVA